MSKKLTLTIITAVLNEEKNLPSFLAYATKLAEEVIVVIDYRTTDQSADIARKSGCKVLVDTGKSDGIVFNNKNWGIREASHNWILILDVDEILDETMEKELKEIVTNDPDPDVAMYQTGFINIEFGQKFDKCEQKNKKFIRFVRKGSFGYNTDSTAEGFGIHAKSIGNSLFLRVPWLRSWAIAQNPKIKNLKGYIIHNSHPTIKDFIRKINHYSTREAKLLYQRSSKPSMILLTFKMYLNPMREFIQKYFIWKMYKEGTRGAVVSILYSFYHFLIIAKYIQLITQSSSPHKQE